MRPFLRAALIACLGVPFPTAILAQSQSYPVRPVRVLLGYTSGGTADFVGRLLAEKLARSFGQPVIFENRPGASGNIAAQLAVNSPADGYTLLMGAPAEIAINRHAMKNMGFNPETGLVPIALAFDVPFGLLVPGKSSFLSLGDLIAKARSEPGKISFANSGIGSPAHMAGEILALNAKIVVTQVPYKGGAPAMTDLIAGRVDAYFLGIPGAMPHVKNGNVRVIGVSTPKRSGIAPDVPTLIELGIPDFSFSLWAGFFAPAGTPADIIARLNREIMQAFSQPDVQEKLAIAGSDVIRTTPEEFGRFVQAETLKYADIVKRINYKAE
ncbi:MAG: tripartite tricarboxylate transporter substrate binding protein [Betaproteobacteria bacterium]|nr:tripartite tricarboxylate transporter substrate binding protein [Betaproteobacteria bacterium]